MHRRRLTEGNYMLRIWVILRRNCLLWKLYTFTILSQAYDNTESTNVLFYNFRPLIFFVLFFKGLTMSLPHLHSLCRSEKPVPGRWRVSGREAERLSDDLPQHSSDWITESRKKCHRADLQPKNLLWEISPAPARSLRYNFIAKWQMHKECVMVPSTLTHTLTPVTWKKQL